MSGQNVNIKHFNSSAFISGIRLIYLNLKIDDLEDYSTSVKRSPGIKFEKRKERKGKQSKIKIY